MLWAVPSLCGHWKVRRIVAPKNSINVGCAPSEQVDRIYSVRYQPVTGRHGKNPCPLERIESGRQDDQSPAGFLRECSNGRF
jgi:hypothetical protein